MSWVSDATAAYVNPAGLGLLGQPEAQVGFMVGVESFRALPPVYWDTNRDGITDGRDTPLQVSSNVDDIIGFTAATGRNIGKKFGIGLSVYVPATRIIRFMTYEPSLPTYFMHYNRPQRFVLAMGVGGLVAKGVRLGASFELVPGSESVLAATLSGGLQNADSEGDVLDPFVVDVHQVSVNLKNGGSPMVGLQLDFGQWSDALTGLNVGVTWRAPVGFPLTIVGDVQANGSIDLEDLSPYVAAAILQGQLQMTDHYVPMTLTSGISYTTPTGHGTYLDIIWKDWRPMTEAVARFSDGTLLLPLADLSSGVVDNNDMDVVLKATVTVRGGAEFALPRATLNNGFQYAQTRIRVGGGYDPTPLGSQGSDSALLDTDRVMASLGLSVETADPLQLLGGPIQFDLFGQFHGYLPRFLPHETEACQRQVSL